MITFCDRSPLTEEIQKLKDKNKSKNNKYWIIIDGGGSPTSIVDSYLSNNRRIEVEDSQETDKFNIEWDYREDTPITVHVVDFEAKSIDTIDYWII